MSKRTLLLIVLLTVITSILLAIALQPPKPAPKTVMIPTPTPVAQSELSFGALTTTISSISGSLTYSLPVLINTRTNKVTAVQLELQYDPKVLTNVSVSPGAFFSNPLILLTKIDQKSGRISYALGIAFNDSGQLGQGEVAVLSFGSTVQTPVSTMIQFLPKSLVTAEGVLESVLSSTNSADFIVGR